MMQYPANRKLRLMIRRAGTPMASMFSSAWNIMSRSRVNSWNTTRPMSMMPTAM